MKPRRQSRPASDQPVLALHERALDNVAFVRGVMERSVHFTAVPGWGGIAMGVSALITALIASRQGMSRAWLNSWIIDAVLAAAIAIVSVALKARRTGVPLGIGPTRRFALCLAPALIAGAALTFAIASQHAYAMLPAIWLLLYGTGVCAAGAVSSPRVVSTLGIALIGGGVAAVLSPAEFGDWYLAAFFGLGHIVAGAIIVRNHGG